MAATYEPIASQTFTNVASVTFSGIAATYTDLILFGTTFGVSGNASPRLRMGNASVDTGTNYSDTELFGNGTSAGSQRVSNADHIVVGLTPGSGTSAAVGFFTRLQLMSYANTNVYKTVLQESGRAGTGVTRDVGLWRSTVAVDVITYYASVNISGTLSLYGIKGA